MNLYLFFVLCVTSGCRCKWIDQYYSAPLLANENVPLTARIDTQGISNAIVKSLEAPIERLSKSLVNKEIDKNEKKINRNILDVEVRTKGYCSSEVKLLKNAHDNLNTSIAGINRTLGNIKISMTDIQQNVKNVDERITISETRATDYCKSELELQQENVRKLEHKIKGINRKLAVNLDTVRDLILDSENRVKEFYDSELKSLRESIKTKDNEMMEINNKFENLQTAYSKLKQRIDSPNVMQRLTDCVYIDKKNRSGVYTIFPGNRTKGVKVYCDMETDGGGWTVFQRRIDGSTNFTRNWSEYEHGFGELKKEFWLGNSVVHSITSQGQYELRIDLADFESNKRFAKYTTFSIGDKVSNYKLTVDGYTGDAGNSMKYHNGRPFTTMDKDNDGYSGHNCAEWLKGGWWFLNCHHSNLNGAYLNGYHNLLQQGVNWRHWKGNYYSLKYTTMMTRKVK